LRPIQGGQQIFDGVGGCRSQQTGDATARIFLGNRPECFWCGIIKGIAQRTVNMDIDQPWRNQATPHIDRNHSDPSRAQWAPAPLVLTFTHIFFPERYGKITRV
jgi:hypothetical protein